MPDNIDYRDEIDKLIHLQEFDAEIYELMLKKEFYPARMREMDDSLEGKKSGMQAAEEALKAIQVAKNAKETDIKAKEDKIAKHEAELNAVTTNKEYKALLEEIGNIKADISVIEDAVIGLFDQIDAASAALAREKEIFEQEKKSVENEKQAIAAEEKEVDARLGELGAKRDEAVKGVNRDVLGEYARILRHTGKAAMAKIDGELCGECRMLLPPQVINEAMMRKRIVRCENCSRILYT